MEQEEEPERNELITEKAIEEMCNEVTKALALQHPMMYETYNICEIVGQSNRHPWGRNECVTNEPQRMSAGRLRSV